MQNRYRYVSFRLKDAELELLQVMARAEGLNQSQFIRKCIRERLENYNK